MAQTLKETLGVEKKYLVVKYEEFMGEYGTIQVIGLEANSNLSDDEVIHRYFKNYFGNDTRCKKKALRYDDWDKTVKISYWEHATPEEFNVLKKFIITDHVY